MSIFGNIMSGIFSQGSAKVQPASSGSVAPSPTSASSSTAAATSAAAPPSQVDVEAVLSKLASQNKEKLDWRKSITAARRWASFRAPSRKAAVDLKIRPIALPERPRQSVTVRPRLSGKSWARGQDLTEFSK
jgi:Domain of unknown function (DUF3597)